MVHVAWEQSRNIPDFGWEAAAARVKGAHRWGRRGGGAGRDVPPRSPSGCPRRFRAHFRRGKSGRAESSGAGAASAGLVKTGNLLIILDRSPRRARRRTFGPVPELQVAQDFFDHGAVADQADDGKGSAAAGTDQGVRFEHFLDQNTVLGASAALAGPLLNMCDVAGWISLRRRFFDLQDDHVARCRLRPGRRRQKRFSSVLAFYIQWPGVGRRSPQRSHLDPGQIEPMPR